MHARQQIRDAVVTVLTGNVGATVVPSRIWTLQTDELPLVGVYTNTEAVSLDEGGASMGSPNLYRELEVMTDIAVIAETGVLSSNALDTIAEAIEDELAANRDMVGIIDILPAAVEVDQSSEGEQVISRMTVTFNCEYRTAVGTAGTIV